MAKRWSLLRPITKLENLPSLVDRIRECAPDVVTILVIDDNSPGWHGALVAMSRRGRGSAVALPAPHGQILGWVRAILVAGMKYAAIDGGYTFVVNMDADFSHDPTHLPELIEGMNRSGQGAVDVMIGSRYVPGGKIEGWPIKRHFMSRAINIYARALLGLKPKDCSGGYRCYRASRLAQLDFSTLKSRGYSFQEEMLWQLKRLGCRFAETPITFVDRQRGNSKINYARSATANALGIIADLGRRNLFPKPLRAQQDRPRHLAGRLTTETETQLNL